MSSLSKLPEQPAAPFLRSETSRPGTPGDAPQAVFLPHPRGPGQEITTLRANKPKRIPTVLTRKREGGALQARRACPGR